MSETTGAGSGAADEPDGAAADTASERSAAQGNQARTGGPADHLATLMAEHHLWLIGQMVDRAARLSADRLDRPVEVAVDDETRSLRGLLSRLIGQLDMWTCVVAGRPYDWTLEDDEPVDSMRSRITRVGPEFLGLVRAATSGGRLGDEFTNYECDPPEQHTLGGMVAHVLTFGAYNRTLAVLALGRAGIGDLGWGDPMGWPATRGGPG